jgi:hypothetical protein
MVVYLFYFLIDKTIPSAAQLRGGAAAGNGMTQTDEAATKMNAMIYCTS